MALKFLEGFDDGLDPYRWSTPFATVGSSYGRFGNGGRLANGVQAAVASFAVYGSGQWMGFAARPTTTTTGADGYLVANSGSVGTTTNFYLRPSGADMIWNRGNGSASGTFSNVLVAGEWSYWEVYLLIHNTAGELTIKQNGTTLYSATGVDTYYAGTDGWWWFEGSIYHLFDYDDFYADDAGFRGDMRVDALLPSGNGTTSQLTGSDADSTNNYLHVDEASQDGDTTYVEHATDGNKDTYAYDNHPASTGTVHGLIVANYARKTDTAAKSFRNVVRSGGTDYTGSDMSLGTGYALYEEVFSTDPDTSSPWTISGVNAAEFGFEVRP